MPPEDNYARRRARGLKKIPVIPENELPIFGDRSKQSHIGGRLVPGLSEFPTRNPWGNSQGSHGHHLADDTWGRAVGENYPISGKRRPQGT